EMADRQKAEDRAFQQQQKHSQQQQREAELHAQQLHELHEQQKLDLQDQQLRANLFEAQLQRDHEREKMQHDLALAQLQTQPVTSPRRTDGPTFRVDSAVKMMPKLINELEIDVYLITFERIASLNKWPKEHWSALIQTQLRGKGLRVFAELPTAQCQDYEVLKETLLIAYELAPEIYRKRFRSLVKLTSDTYSDFAFKQNNLCKRWLQSIKALDSLENLFQAILMEQFRESCSPDLTLWLMDQKTKSLVEMAKAADSFTALRKSLLPLTEIQKSADSAILTNFKSKWSPKPFRKWGKQGAKPAPVIKPAVITPVVKTPFPTPSTFKRPVICFGCGKPNHVIAQCKERKTDYKQAKDTMLITTNYAIAPNTGVIDTTRSNKKEILDNMSADVSSIHPLFVPFCKQASVLSSDGNVYPIQYLRDTAALQSVILRSAIPSTAFTCT